MKELLKLDSICESYAEMKNGQFFDSHSQCRLDASVHRSKCVKNAMPHTAVGTYEDLCRDRGSMQEILLETSRRINQMSYGSFCNIFIITILVQLFTQKTACFA